MRWPNAGELIVIAPVGFKKTDDHRLEKDPDRRVHEAIRLVFDQFRADRVGSPDAALVPRTRLRSAVRYAGWRGSLEATDYGTVYQLLTNPAYGGAYAYGKSEHGTRYEGGVVRTNARGKPREQWLAFIPGTHEGYVAWERFERIQRAIRGNLRRAVITRSRCAVKRAGPPRAG